MNIILIIVLIPLGLLFIVQSRFLAVSIFDRIFRILGHAVHHEKDHLSFFQVLTLRVAGRMDPGNIGGVSLAIAFTSILYNFMSVKSVLVTLRAGIEKPQFNPRKFSDLKLDRAAGPDEQNLITGR